jgi:hypothetical protein
MRAKRGRTKYAIIALMMEAVRTSETLVYFHEATRATSQKAEVFVLYVVLSQRYVCSTVLASIP